MVSVYLTQFKEQLAFQKKKVSANLQNSRKKILYLALSSSLLFIIYISYFLNPISECFKLDGESNSLGLSFSYNLEMVQNFFTARSESQLDCYIKFLTIWDVVFAMIYTLMYGSWIMYLFNNKKIYLTVPILGMVSDWSENYSEVLMLENYLNSGSISQTLVSIGSGINSFKWVMSSLTYLIILVGIVIAIKSFLRRSTAN